MKYIAFLISGLMLLGTTASAQEPADTAAESSPAATAASAEPEAAASAPEAPKEEEEKRSPYYKKVQGWLWIEGFVGPSSYDPDQFGSLGALRMRPSSRDPKAASRSAPPLAARSSWAGSIGKRTTTSTS